MEKSAARGNGQIKIITSWLRKRVPPGDVVEDRARAGTRPGPTVTVSFFC